MIRLPARRGVGAPRRRGVRLPTAANVPRVAPRGDPGVVVPAGAFGNGLALADLGAAIGDVGETVRKEERKRTAEEALKEAARQRQGQKSDGTDEPEQPPQPEPKPEAPPESGPTSAVEDAARAVKYLDVALNKAMNDVLIGGDGEDYLSSQGEAAMAAYGSARQALIALAEDYLGQTGSEHIRRRFEPVAVARLHGKLAAVERHHKAQLPVAEDEASRARIDNAIADATGRPDDPGAFLQARAIVHDETLQIAERNGQSAEVARQAANAAVEKLHAGVVESLVDRDPEAAHAYLATNRDAIARSARTELDELVQEGLIPVAAEPAAREIHANGGTLAERGEAVESYTAERTDKRLSVQATPAFQQAVTQHLERLDAEDTARVRDRVRQAAEAAWDAVYAGGDIYSIPATDRYQLRRHDPETVSAVNKVASARRRGEDIETDPHLFGYLLRRAGYHPNAFVEIDLPKFQARLSQQDYEHLRDVQDRLKAGGDGAKQTAALLRTMIRKAGIAARRPAETTPEIFHRFVTDVRDLQVRKGGQLSEADMDRLLAEYEREADTGVVFDLAAVAQDIRLGIEEAPEQVAGGAMSGLNEASDLLFSMSEWISDKFGDAGKLWIGKDPGAEGVELIPGMLWWAPGDGKNDLLIPDEYIPDDASSVTGGMIRGIAQFLVGYAAGGQLLKGVKTATTLGRMGKAALQGGIADAAFFDTQDARFADLVQQYPTLRNPLTAFLATDPNDSKAVAHFKMALSGLLPGVLVDGLAMVARGMRARLSKRPSSSTNEAKSVVQDDELNQSLGKSSDLSSIEIVEEGAFSWIHKKRYTTNAKLIKEWERREGRAWPLDPKTGRKQDVSHEPALADGVPDNVLAIRPRPHDEHMKMHMEAGDFARWAKRKGKVHD